MTKSPFSHGLFARLVRKVHSVDHLAPAVIVSFVDPTCGEYEEFPELFLLKMSIFFHAIQNHLAFVSRNRTTYFVEQEFRLQPFREGRPRCCPGNRNPFSITKRNEGGLTGRGRSGGVRRLRNSRGTDILVSGIGHPVCARCVRRVTTTKKYQRASARTFRYRRTNPFAFTHKSVRAQVKLLFLGLFFNFYF